MCCVTLSHRYGKEEHVHSCVVGYVFVACEKLRTRSCNFFTFGFFHLIMLT